MKIGEVIRKYRKEKQMTQEEMVKEAVEEAKKAVEEQDAAQEAAGEDPQHEQRSAEL